MVYKEYLLKNYIENGKLSPETVKLRLVIIGNQLRTWRKEVNIGEAAFAELLDFCGFKCTSVQIRNMEAGLGYNAALLIKYIEVIKALMEEKNIRFELNKLFN